MDPQTEYRIKTSRHRFSLFNRRGKLQCCTDRLFVSRRPADTGMYLLFPIVRQKTAVSRSPTWEERQECDGACKAEIANSSACEGPRAATLSLRASVKTANRSAPHGLESGNCNRTGVDATSSLRVDAEA